MKLDQCHPCANARLHSWWGPGWGTHCKRCHLSWTSKMAAHCTKCCGHFTSNSAADKHWVDGRHKDASAIEGLSLNESGVYTVPWPT